MRNFILILLLMAAGCTTGTETRPSAEGPRGLPERLEEGIAQLTASIDGLDRRMAARRESPALPEDGLEELETLDYAAWQLRRQQWVLQREHLVLARKLLGQAHASPADKTRFVEQWNAHAREHMALLEDLRQQRQASERKRLQLEAQVIERALR